MGRGWGGVASMKGGALPENPPPPNPPPSRGRARCRRVERQLLRGPFRLLALNVPVDRIQRPQQRLLAIGLGEAAERKRLGILGAKMGGDEQHRNLLRARR